MAEHYPWVARRVAQRSRGLPAIGLTASVLACMALARD